MSQTALMRSMKNFLNKYYTKKNIDITKDYILCEGDIPIVLVAHMDTVFKTPPEKIYYDSKYHVMWSPQGLGADDRAGVYLIWRIVQAGYRPHIILTTDEEKGGLGAIALVHQIPEVPFDVKYIIELDRQGMNDCVFYSCANDEFEKYIENFGFVTDWGTFSDISDICPAWKIAGVNLSVGYFGEHRETETLNTSAMMSTYNKVINMLNSANDAPHFEYIPDMLEKYYFSLGRKYMTAYGYPLDDEDEWEYERKLGGYFPAANSIASEKCQCSKCGKIYDKDDVFLVKAKDFEGSLYYCVDCIDTNINWCKKCGEPFEVEHEDDEICPDCAGKKRVKTVVM